MKCEYCGEKFEPGMHTEHGQYCKKCFGPKPKRRFAEEQEFQGIKIVSCGPAQVYVGAGGSGGSSGKWCVSGGHGGSY